jgi:hypothetical protein
VKDRVEDEAEGCSDKNYRVFRCNRCTEKLFFHLMHLLECRIWKAGPISVLAIMAVGAAWAGQAEAFSQKGVESHSGIARTNEARVVYDRARLLAGVQLAEPDPLPVPGPAIFLSDERERDQAPVVVQLTQAPAGELSVRRVSRGDGRLYLEVRSAAGPLSGAATVTRGDQQLGRAQLDGSLWLSLKPAMGRISIPVFAAGAKEPVLLTAPATLVEVRGRRIFLNGEPFLLKGATGQVSSQRDADYVHCLGLNTLRGLGALPGAEQYGFMTIASLNFGGAAPTKMFQAPDAQFSQGVPKCLAWLREYSAAPIASPATLILQLGNERTGAGPGLPGTVPLSRARQHVCQLLAEARNAVKSTAPMLPVGYANQDLGFLAPDCMDVYMHNSFLHKDRYNYSWEEFMRWQGCVPPEGKAGEGRPFVNSEFGANRYLCQAYHGGPNNPFLEKIHAWNLPCRWAEFMDHGTVGGAIYCLRDLDSPRDQGCSCFGILTHDGQPKLACWEVSHMWRDFEVEVAEKSLILTSKRDYWARHCRLTLRPLGGEAVTRELEDFAPRSQRTLAFGTLARGGLEKGVRWSMDFTTHSGLVNKATGAWPKELEEGDFLESLKARDTYPFLRELFDTEVLMGSGKPAPRTLVEMTNGDGLIPVALRKRNGVTYLLVIARENPNKNGSLREGVNIDVAFQGKVVKVDDMTGQPLPGEKVDAEPIAGGVRLKNIKAGRIPGPIGERAAAPFMLPVYRISP